MDGVKPDRTIHVSTMPIGQNQAAWNIFNCQEQARVTQRPYTGCKDLVDFGGPSVSSANLTLPDYVRVARDSGTILEFVLLIDGPSPFSCNADC